MARIGSIGADGSWRSGSTSVAHRHDAEQQRVLGQVAAEGIGSDPGGPQQLGGSERVGGKDDDIGAYFLLQPGEVVAQHGSDHPAGLADDARCRGSPARSVNRSA